MIATRRPSGIHRRDSIRIRARADQAPGASAEELPQPRTGEHVRQLVSRDLWRHHATAGRHHDGVGGQTRDGVRVERVAEVHLDTQARDLAAQEVEEGLVLFVHHRGHREGSAQMALLLVYGDAVAAAREQARRLEAARPGAHHDHALAPRRRRPGELRFAPGEGIHGAAHATLLHRVDAVLARDAAADLGEAPPRAICSASSGSASSGRPIAIRSAWPSREDPLRQARVVDAPHRHHGRVDHALDGGGGGHVVRVAEMGARHHLGRERVDHAAAHVEGVDAGRLQLGRHPLRLLERAPARRRARSPRCAGSAGTPLPPPA